MILLARETLGLDGQILFAARIVRLFGYGMLSVVLVLYLVAVRLSPQEIGFLLTLTLVGDTAVSLWLTTRADRFGRKKTLFIGSLLVVAAGLIFALSGTFWPLLVAATIGVISPSGGEVGPFLPVEQAGLSEGLTNENRTVVFAWYTLVGSIAAALGALMGGFATQALQNRGFAQVDSYRFALLGYAAVGLILATLFSRLSSSVETSHPPVATQSRFSLGLQQSRGVVFRLSGLFAMDAFGGAFVLQSVIAYWFHLQFGTHEAVLGGIIFGANLLAGFSALAAARLATRFGLVNTMVFTHLPSNVLLILVPLMPTEWLAIAMLFLRFALSQMDVPTRQSYVMQVVPPGERSAAAGVTGVARTLGASMAPILALPLLATSATLAAPFFVAGGLKIAYDLLLYRNCRSALVRSSGPR